MHKTLDFPLAKKITFSSRLFFQSTPFFGVPVIVVAAVFIQRRASFCDTSLCLCALSCPSCNMGPTNKKRASSLLPCSDSKQAATGKAKGTKTPTKKPVPKPLSALGFSATKRQQFSVDTKLLLGTDMYDTPVPAQVKDYMFVYKIVEFLDDGKHVHIQYKGQVVKEGGNTFCVYKDSKEAQVSFGTVVSFVVKCNAILVSHFVVVLFFLQQAS
jgi:RNase P/RNase MRP subunit p29